MSTLDRAFIKLYEEVPGGTTWRAEDSAPLSEVAQALAPAAGHRLAARRAAQAEPREPIAREAAPRELASSQRDQHSHLDEQPTLPISAARPLSAAAPLGKPTAAPAPLSSFMPVATPVEAASAGLEIERLVWPAACHELLASSGPAWDAFCDQLTQGRNHRCVAITSCHRGEGRTTISLALAKRLAERGSRPVIVEADMDHPCLAPLCGAAPRSGWSEVLSSELPLSDALIHARHDRVSLMPWQGTTRLPQLSTLMRTTTSFAMLREQFDVIVIDAPPMAGQSTIAEFASFAKAIELDALYLIHDARAGQRAALSAACAKLRRAGLPVAGLIENFSAPAGTFASAAPVLTETVRG